MLELWLVPTHIIAGARDGVALRTNAPETGVLDCTEITLHEK